MNVTSLRHRWTGNGYLCPATGKTTSVAWTDHERPDTGNSCEHCTGEARSLGGMLRQVERQRSTARPAAPSGDESR